MSHPRLVSWSSCALMAISSLSVTVACRRNEITHTRVAKAKPQASPSMPPLGALLFPSGSAALKWKLPRGWSQQGPSGMRYATLRPTTTGRVDVSVVALSGEAGGELANVNRWRGQIGLPPIDESALKTVRQTVTSAAGLVSVYDFASQGQNPTRLVVGWLPAHDGSWFLKMTGDAGPVLAARPDFLRWMETLSFDATHE